MCQTLLWRKESQDVGRRGWSGSPPIDDADARRRILQATIRCVERGGPQQTTLSDVAEELGIARKTIYNYFTGTEQLFVSVADFMFTDWQARVQLAAKGTSDPVEMIVESVAFAIEELPHEQMLTLLLSSGHADLYSRSMVGRGSIKRSREFLLGADIGWSTLGLSEDDIDELVEHLLRVMQSMVVAPPKPPRGGAELRAYLRRWVVPDFDSLRHRSL